MQKVSYMGDGITTEFSFNFPFFENTNVIVTENGTPATGYSIVGTSATPDADIPYVGGTVVFEIAPTTLDCITIARQLPLTRIVDYQPTSKLEPTTLNQDANYLMEIIKDLQDEFDDLRVKYAEIADKESVSTLLARIDAIHDEITTVSAQITALGDVSTIRNDITTLKGYDYVIESQLPTAQNNYTWYRKYKSGWVEQGGQKMPEIKNYELPIRMADTHYTVLIATKNNYGITIQYDIIDDKHITATSEMTTGDEYNSWDGLWYVTGLCA